MPQGSEIGSAYLTIKAQPDASFANEIGEMGTDAGNMFSGKFGAVMGKLPGILAGLGIGAAIGKELFDVGATFDKMTDAIVIGTGASGEALDSLVASAKTIGTSVPTDFEKVGDVVQNLNTRMGIMGDDLEALGTRVIAAGNMLGESINLDTLTGAFNAFGVANEEAAAKMDYLFNVGQATGISMNNLTSVLEANAPALQNLGFTFEESANMAGLLDKAGMDASATMSKMSKALVELSEPGESAADAYQRVVGEMMSYIEAGDTAAAIDIASTVFGTKGAAQFVGALQSGALSMEELTDASLGAGDGIMATMEATMDWDESWQMLQNSIMVALEPLASGLLETISGAVQNLTSFVQENSDTFNALGEVLGFVANIIGGVVGTALNLAFTLIGNVTKAVQTLIGGFQSMVATVKGVFDNVVNTIKGAVDKIKNLFHFDFHLPSLKLPHIVVGEYIDVPVLGRIPNPTTLHVEWYKQGGIVNGPQLIGAGEAGAEAIVPLTAPNVLPFAEAVADMIDGKGDTFVFNITADSETTLQRLVQEAQRARLQYA